MFDSKFFDTWLNLLLKAQTNHFHHMDDEFRNDFKIMKSEIKEFKEEMREEFKTIRSDIL